MSDKPDFSFFVPGTPASKGSLNKGRNGNLYPSDPKLKAWAHAVAWHARIAAPQAPPTTEPIEINILFKLPGGINVHTKKPDLDKLIRAILDSLTGIVYKDDCQVWNIHASKVYSTEPGAKITVGYWK